MAAACAVDAKTRLALACHGLRRADLLAKPAACALGRVDCVGAQVMPERVGVMVVMMVMAEVGKFSHDDKLLSLAAVLVRPCIELEQA
jgi:hypothetical protein